MARSAGETQEKMRAQGKMGTKAELRDRGELVVRNLSVTFRLGRQQIRAVENVSFQVSPGQTVGLVGSSGSGKSTVLNALLSLVTPARGELYLPRPVGYTPQDPFTSLPQYLTAEEIVTEPYKFLGIRFAPGTLREKTVQMFTLMGLDYQTYRSKLPSQLSGGERQRLLLARALIVEPKSLLLDEPTSMVDEHLKKEFSGLIRSISQRGNIAILLVTHDLTLATSLCDTLMIMKDGEVIESAPTATLLSHPQTSYTKSLLSPSYDLQGYLNNEGPKF